MVEGDKLYKTLNAIDLLNMDDLPHSVRLWKSRLPITFLSFLKSQASLVAGHVFFRNSIPSNNHVSTLFFMDGLTVTIIQKN